MSRLNPAPVTFDDAAPLADAILARVGKTIVLALPLGLGKANHIANALYAKAVADRSIRLTIFTALTLVVPRTKNELERRFLEPISRRAFGGYPALDYANAIRAGTLPPNVQVNEFFFQPVNGWIRLMRSRTTFPQTIPTPCNTYSNAVST
jgi:hypothetical protein